MNRNLFCIGALLLSLVRNIDAQPSAFTYQGRLVNSNAPANGLFDFQMRLYNVASGGSQVGNTASVPDISVSNGLFTVSLDFGAAAFDGTPRWLEIDVRTNKEPDFTTLSPRQAVTAAPYSVRAINASSVPPGAITSNMLAPGAVGALQLAAGSITADKLATNSVGFTQLSRHYLSGSVLYSALTLVPVTFAPFYYDYQVSFSSTFNITPVVTLTVDTPHPALPTKGAPLITSRSVDQFSMRIPSAAVGVEIARSSTGTGLRPSIRLVNGNPAVIGAGSANSAVGIVYSRSLDAYGANWSAPIVVRPGYYSAAFLNVANGNPTITFIDNNGGVSYMRATDLNGTNWPAPTQIINPTNYGTASHLASLPINGNPAVIMSTATNLYFLRASDSSGTNWGSPVKLFSLPAAIASIDMKLVSAYPAIAAMAGQIIYYTGALDQSGTAWPAPVVAVPDSNPASTLEGPYSSVSLIDANSKPGIGYVNYESAGSATRAMFALSPTFAGSSWNSPQQVVPPDAYLVSPTFNSVSSSPMLAYTRNSILYFQSSTATGPYGWPSAIALEPGTSECDIADIYGQPAIAFYGNGALRFIRSGTAPPNSTVNWIAVEP